MPTPIGHALGALLITAPIRARYRLLGAGAAMGAVALGVAPDLDLLVGRHSAETHSLGAAALTGALAWLFLRWRGRPRAGAFAAVLALAVLSHALLDWLGSDTSAPIGIMALWPFSTSYYESDAHVFMAVSRRYWLDEFWSYNLRVLARELLLLGVPALAIEWWMRGPHVGACANLGPREVRRRQRMGVAFLAIAMMMFVALVYFDAPRLMRLLLLAPLWMSALGFLQAREKT